MASRSYLTWSVPKLRAELATRGASVGGRKTDLIERLKAYDRNRDFQPPPLESVPAPVSVGWPVSGYQQLQKEHKVFLPKITKEQIDQYFVYRMAGDKQFTKDIKAVSKGNAMFQGNRVQACSVTVKDNSIYFTGIVGAAMKNKVSYNYKLKMDKSTGDTLNSDCECPAGKGPHGTCKHLAAVLLMLQHFTETGSVVIDKSCTENLQLFHKPKATYHGVPVDAESIPSRKRPSDESLEDPRPAKFRKVPGYQDYVRSLLINYCSMTSEDIALRYLFGKANIQVAAVDHYYTRIPVTEYWVDEANKITEADVGRIEIIVNTAYPEDNYVNIEFFNATEHNFSV
eukprot:XP_011451771.1 PREDICTED: uncharacterized protein LOC105345344 [Crassostrea gigas]